MSNNFSFTQAPSVGGAYSISSPAVMVVNKIVCKELVAETINTINVHSQDLLTESVLANQAEIVDIITNQIISNTSIVNQIINAAVASITSTLSAPILTTINTSINSIQSTVSDNESNILALQETDLTAVVSNVTTLSGR